MPLPRAVSPQPGRSVEAVRFIELTGSRIESATAAICAQAPHALVANSGLIRSQEQFHIHLGCLAPVLQRWMSMVAPKLPIGAWSRVDLPIGGAAFWGLRTGPADLSSVDPLRLAAEGLGDKIQKLTRLTIVVVGVRIADSDESVILAAYASASGMLSEASAESILDPDCSDGSRFSRSN